MSEVENMIRSFSDLVFYVFNFLGRPNTEWDVDTDKFNQIRDEMQKAKNQYRKIRKYVLKHGNKEPATESFISVAEVHVEITEYTEIRRYVDVSPEIRQHYTEAEEILHKLLFFETVFRPIE